MNKKLEAVWDRLVHMVMDCGSEDGVVRPEVPGWGMYAEEGLERVTLVWVNPCGNVYATPGFEGCAGIDICVCDPTGDTIRQFVIDWDGKGGVTQYFKLVGANWNRIMGKE